MQDNLNIQFAGICKHCGGAIYFDFDNDEIIPHGGVDCICELDDEEVKAA